METNLELLNELRSMTYLEYVEKCGELSITPVAPEDFESLQKEVTEDDFTQEEHPSGKLLGIKIPIGRFVRQATAIASRMAKRGEFGQRAKSVAEAAEKAANIAANIGIASEYIRRSGGGGGSNNPPSATFNFGYSSESPSRHHIPGDWPSTPQTKFQTGVKLPSMSRSSKLRWPTEPDIVLSASQFTMDLDPTINKVWNAFIAPSIANEVARNVNFALNYESEFNPQNLGKIFASITNLYLAYFQLDAVISHSSDLNNIENRSMSKLRSQISSESYNTYQIARDLLSRIPTPPNLRALAYFLSQNYMLSDNPRSCIARFDFEASLINSDKGEPIHKSLAFHLQNFDDIKPRGTLDKISKGIPSWSPEVPPLSSSKPIYDVSFDTLFRNSGIVNMYEDTKGETIPNVQDSNQGLSFFCPREDLDGFIYAMTPAYNFETRSCEFGVITPCLPSGMKCNRAYGTGSEFACASTLNPVMDGAHFVFGMDYNSRTIYITCPPGWASLAFNSQNTKRAVLVDCLKHIYSIPTGSSGSSMKSPRKFRKKGGK